MHVPIGVSDFRELIEYRTEDGERFLFVDKSLFIREITTDPARVIVLTRPRRCSLTSKFKIIRRPFKPSKVNTRSSPSA